MSRKTTIQYAIDQETGLIISRVDSEVAIPVLDFAGMTPENGYQTDYPLEKFSVYDTVNMSLTWTRKIPIEDKNAHRQFWGFKPF